MRSSRARVMLASLSVIVAAGVWTSTAAAQQSAQGFDLERLYASAPGAGWIVMDALDMHGRLGGAVNLVTSYARNPLRIGQGPQRLAVVADEAFMQLGAAATYDRFRLYFTFDSPLTVHGSSGIAGGYTFTGPSIDPATAPDAISHGRAGFDARVLGSSTSAFRLGLGAQLWFPGGAPGSLRSNYLSDGPPGNSLGAYNAMARVLFAGDVGWFSYAGQFGLHLRQVDETPTPEGPQGNELLFGIAAGVRATDLGQGSTALVVGPEVYGASAVRSFLSTTGTALEGLLSARWEGTADNEPQLRIKLGAGGGINPHFGAPEWRFVFAIELFSILGADHGT